VVDDNRYGTVAQALHWIIAILVLAAFIYGPGGSEQRVYSAAKDFDRQVHETLGLAVFSLVFVRALWRHTAGRPPAPAMPRWMRLASGAVEGLLYVLLFLVPATAIAGAWLEGHPLTLLGGTEIAPWIAKRHELGHTIAEVHTWLGDAILWLAGLHAAAGLYHHFVLRDAVLVSMLPRRFTRRGSRDLSGRPFG
jgi:cytochrome b561